MYGKTGRTICPTQRDQKREKAAPKLVVQVNQFFHEHSAARRMLSVLCDAQVKMGWARLEFQEEDESDKWWKYWGVLCAKSWSFYCWWAEKNGSPNSGNCWPNRAATALKVNFHCGQLSVLCIGSLGVKNNRSPRQMYFLWCKIWLSYVWTKQSNNVWVQNVWDKYVCTSHDTQWPMAVSNFGCSASHLWSLSTNFPAVFQVYLNQDLTIISHCRGRNDEEKSLLWTRIDLHGKSTIL